MSITLDQQVVFAGNDGGVGDDPAVFTTTGAVAADSTVLLVFFGDQVPTSVTVGGVSATKDREHTNGDKASFWRVHLPGGLSVGGTISADYASAPNYVECVATAFAGITDTSPLDQVNSRSSFNSTSWNSSSITPSEADTVVIGFFRSGGAGDSRQTPDSGWTELHDSGQFGNVVMVYQVVPDTAARNPSGVFASSQTGADQVGITVNYKAAAGGGGTPPANTVAPAVTGNKWRTQTLTTDDGTWTGDATIAYTYQWQRDDSGGGTFGDITGETGDTYVLDVADVDCQVRCVVTGTNGAGSDTANSNAVTVGDLYTGPAASTGRVEVCGSAVVSYTTGTDEPPVNTVAPAVTGNKWRTQTLTTDDGTWDGSPAPTITYQWQRDNSGGGSFSNIVGETASTYDLDASDVGCQVRCRVTGTNTEGAATASSNAITAGDLYTGPPAATGRVEVRGSAVVDYDIPLAPGAGGTTGNLASPSMSSMRF